MATYDNEARDAGSAALTGVCLCMMWRTGGLVGKGSFGSVVQVTRKSDGARLVMKRLPIHSVTEKEMEAYQNEIRLLSELVRHTLTRPHKRRL